MSSQWAAQKLFQGLVPHKLRAYLSIFSLFNLNELWPYYWKHVNQIILNITLCSLALPKFEAFVPILLILNLSLNQNLLPFLLYVRQTWMTELVLAISLWGIISLSSERILVLISMVSHICEGRTSFWTGLISRKLCRFLFIFSTGFLSLSV